MSEGATPVEVDARVQDSPANGGALLELRDLPDPAPGRLGCCHAGFGRQ